ncbi:ribonuclease H-like domain-containing protein [Tanacetum coccineum]
MPPTPDLSFTGLKEFTSEPVVIKPVVENSQAKTSEAKPKVVRKNNDAPIIEDWVSDNEEEDVPQAKIEKKTVKSSFAKIEFVKPKQQENTARKTVNHVMQNRQNTHAPRGNQRNWNNMMSQILGSNFEMFNKACYVCGSFDRLQIQVSDGLGPQKKLIFLPNVHGNPQMDLQDQGVIDSGCSRHMTGNMSYLTDYEEIDGGYVAFGGNSKGGKITRKATKDETSGILKSFITGIENLVDHKVKIIRCDNGTKFKNKEMNQFCETKGILRQYSVARTPQQNGVAERRNRTLIEAARTMLADSKLPTTFGQKQLILLAITPTLSFIRPFGCPVIILDTIDHLGKFDGKADEGFFVGYSLNSIAFRVFNIRTRIVEENLHIRFSENTPNVVGTKASDNAGQASKETEPVKNYILLPLWTADPPFFQDPKSSQNDGFKPSSDYGKKVDKDPRKDSEFNDQEKEDNVNSTNNVNAASTNKVNAVGGKTSIELLVDPDMPELEDYSIFENDEEVGVEADMNNLNTTIQVSPIPTTRIHKDHPLDQVTGDLQSATQTRRMSKSLEEHGFVRFEDPDFPDRVYKVKKALYGLHQAPRAWYETLSTYLLDNEFQRGKIDKTLYIKKYKGDILLVQVYVDDIIFGSTKKELCNAFEKLMYEKF